MSNNFSDSIKEHEDTIKTLLRKALGTPDGNHEKTVGVLNELMPHSTEKFEIGTNHFQSYGEAVKSGNTQGAMAAVNELLEEYKTFGDRHNVKKGNETSEPVEPNRVKKLTKGAEQKQEGTQQKPEPEMGSGSGQGSGGEPGQPQQGQPADPCSPHPRG